MASLYLLLLFGLLVRNGFAATLDVPSSYSTLGDALYVVSPGDTISMAAGTYSGSENCGQSLTVTNVTITGAGSDSTIISCNSVDYVPLFLNANGAVLSDLTVTNSGPSDSGTGLLVSSASQLSISRVILSNGVVQNVPSSMSWRTSGGALSLTASAAPVQLTFTDVSFLNNNVSCTENACIGGAASITIESSVTGDSGSVTFDGCVVNGNQLGAAGTANSMQGAGISIENFGTAPLATQFVNSVFIGNTMRNWDSTSVIATGGAVVFMNINFATDTVYSQSVDFLVSNCSFTDNMVTSELCNSLGQTANGAAIAPFGVLTFTVQDSAFVGNQVQCIAATTSAGCGVSEGGAIFLEGLYNGNPESLQPTVEISDSVFDSNVASCNGPGCLALGGGMAIAVAKEVVMNSIVARNNQAVCMGNAAAAQGGFAQLQNGPQSDVGMVSNMEVVSTNLSAVQNSAVALPMGDYSVKCSVDLAACDGPTYGGAVALLSFNGQISLQANNWSMLENAATCSDDECAVYAAHVGAAAFTIEGGAVANATMQLNSSQFECGALSCANSGGYCEALATTWSSTYYYPWSESGIVGVGGAGCTFIGNDPPSGAGVTVSASCDTAAAGESASVCTDPDSPDDSNSKSDGTYLSQTSVVAISVFCSAAFVILVLAVAVYGFGWEFPKSFQRNRSDDNRLSVPLSKQNVV